MAISNDMVTLRSDLRAGDLGFVTMQHGMLYAREYGFDHTFEAYVAQTVGEFGLQCRPDRDRLWVAERAGRPVGTIGIVGRDDTTAQLRWLLVEPEARGLGLGRTLVRSSLDFCREAGYRRVLLWTVDVLTAAARLYTATGFTLTEAKPPARLWGAMLVEQRYDLAL